MSVEIPSLAVTQPSQLIHSVSHCWGPVGSLLKKKNNKRMSSLSIFTPPLLPRHPIWLLHGDGTFVHLCSDGCLIDGPFASLALPWTVRIALNLLSRVLLRSSGSNWINSVAVSKSIEARGSFGGQRTGQDLWSHLRTCWAWPTVSNLGHWDELALCL